MAKNNLKNWVDSGSIFQQSTLAVNFFRLSLYDRERFGLEEIILLEYLLMMAIKINRNPKKYITKTIISNDTRLKRGARDTALKKLIDKGYVRTDRMAIIKEKPLKTINTIFPNIEKICQDLDVIYTYDNLRPKSDRIEAKEQIQFFFDRIYQNLKPLKLFNDASTTKLHVPGI